MIFDVITLGGLYLCTAGISLLLFLLGLWPGGIYHFWFWNTVTLAVVVYEIYLYVRFGMTLTRLIKQAGTDKPLVAKHKWIARGICLSYALGSLFLVVHFWPR